MLLWVIWNTLPLFACSLWSNRYTVGVWQAGGGGQEENQAPQMSEWVSDHNLWPSSVSRQLICWRIAGCREEERGMSWRMILLFAGQFLKGKNLQKTWTVLKKKEEKKEGKIAILVTVDGRVDGATNRAGRNLTWGWKYTQTATATMFD